MTTRKQCSACDACRERKYKCDLRFRMDNDFQTCSICERQKRSCTTRFVQEKRLKRGISTAATFNLTEVDMRNIRHPLESASSDSSGPYYCLDVPPMGSVVCSLSQQESAQQGAAYLNCSASSDLSRNMDSSMNMHELLNLSDNQRLTGSVLGSADRIPRSGLTRQLEARLMQHYFQYGHRNMPIVDVDEIRMRYSTELPSPLPKYSIATLVAVGSVYRSLLDETDITHADSLQLYRETVDWLLQLIHVLPASIDFLTAMVLILFHRPYELKHARWSQFVKAIGEGMEALQIGHIPQRLFPTGSRKLGVVKHLVWLHYFAEVGTTWPGIKDHGVQMNVTMNALSVSDEDFINSRAQFEQFKQVHDDSRMVMGLQFNELMTEVTRLRMKAIEHVRSGLSDLSGFADAFYSLKSRLPERMSFASIKHLSRAHSSFGMGMLLNIVINDTILHLISDLQATMHDDLDLHAQLQQYAHLESAEEACKREAIESGNQVQLKRSLDLVEEQLQVHEVYLARGLLTCLPRSLFDFSLQGLQSCRILGIGVSRDQHSRLQRLMRDRNTFWHDFDLLS